MTERIGQQLGKYRLVRLLGKGGFAEVYLGQHLYLNISAAIKILHTSLEENDIEDFLHEAQTLANLTHPHIVRVFDFDVENHIPFLVMNYLPNGSIRHSYPKGVPLPLETVISYAKQVASALQYAHDQKIIHRDIKPENMLLDQDYSIVLSDFGIAVIARTSSYDDRQEIAGTAAYMAPEQFRGKPHRASDQYALGIVVYEWLTGSRPFSGSFSELAGQHMFTSPSLLRSKLPTISPAVEQVVLKALEKDPQKRFASIYEFAETLGKASQNSFNPSMSLPDDIIPLREYSATLPTPVNRDSESSSSTSSMPTIPPATMPFSKTISGSIPQSRSTKPETQKEAKDTIAKRISPMTKVGLLIGVILLILGSAIGTFWKVKSNQYTTVNATATTFAQENPYGGKLKLVDPMRDNSKHNGWAQVGQTCYFGAGTYHAVANNPQGPFEACLALGVQQSNVAFEVQMTIIKGNCGGIIFRGNPIKISFYFFRVCSDGNYTLYLVVNPPTFNPIIPASFSKAIISGLNQTNLIAIVANKNNLHLYVNHELIGGIVDNTLTSGVIGVVAEELNTSTEVLYNNTKVWTI